MDAITYGRPNGHLVTKWPLPTSVTSDGPAVKCYVGRISSANPRDRETGRMFASALCATDDTACSFSRDLPPELFADLQIVCVRLPCAVAVSASENECSPMNAPPAIARTDFVTIVFLVQAVRILVARLPQTTQTAGVSCALIALSQSVRSFGTRPMRHGDADDEQVGFSLSPKAGSGMLVV